MEDLVEVVCYILGQKNRTKKSLLQWSKCDTVAPLHTPIFTEDGKTRGSFSWEGSVHADQSAVNRRLCGTPWPAALSGRIPPILIAAKTRCRKIRHNSGLLPSCSTNTGEIKAYRNLPRWIEAHWFVLRRGNRPLSSLFPIIKTHHLLLFYS